MFDDEDEYDLEYSEARVWKCFFCELFLNFFWSFIFYSFFVHKLLFWTFSGRLVLYSFLWTFIFELWIGPFLL